MVARFRLEKEPAASIRRFRKVDRPPVLLFIMPAAKAALGVVSGWLPLFLLPVPQIQYYSSPYSYPLTGRTKGEDDGFHG